MPNEEQPQQRVNQTSLLCLRALFAQFRRNVNFSALLTEDLKKRFLEDECKLIIDLAAAHDMRPEQSETAEIFNSYAGPALVRLDNGNWVIIMDSRQWAGEAVVIYDPTVKNGNQQLRVRKDEVAHRLGGCVIVFRNLAEVDSSKHTAVFCLCAIARHHNVSMDMRRVMHEYAVGEDEPKENRVFQMAADYGFKIKSSCFRWEKISQSSHIFPAMMRGKNGRYAVLCGFRKNPESGETEAVMVDPGNSVETGNHFRFFSRGTVEEEFENKIILLKKTYRLSDENQPFSLLWFLPEFFKLRGVFGQIALTMAMITLFSLVIPLFFQIVVDKVLVNKSYNTLNVLGIGIICVILFNAMQDFVRSYLLLFATNKIDINTATKTFQHLMHLPLDFFEHVPSGVLLKHMQQTEKIRGFLSGNLFFTILDLFSLAIFIPFLLLYSVQLTLVVIGFSVLMALVIASLIKPFQRRLDELYQAEGKRQSMLVESIHGIRTVKSLALEPVERQHWDDTTAYAIKSYFRVGKISMTARSISSALEMMMTICVIWYGAHLVFDHVISIGALIAFQMLAGRVTGPLVKMVGLIHEYQQIALSVRMLGVVMNTAIEPQGGGVRNPLKGVLDFENITFQYRMDTPQVIKHFSLHVDQGKTIGIVGRSGSGKTTLTKLLQGLYSVQSGLIKIDGIDIREIDKAHLRSSIGVVLQENYFFSGTVRENISLTKRSASLEEILYASKLAGADEFVQKLPRGYDTVLEENASNLSGGQKQRLAIARALLTNPPILIFDEATSALDPESECVIQRNLKAIARGRTVLIISHRLSIVRHADAIIVIDKGELTEHGTHEELLQAGGIYRGFWKQQMEGEV